MSSSVQWFRQFAPYINTHRGKTFVIMLPSGVFDNDHFGTLVQDIALLHSLGIRLVLVHGASEQINRTLSEVGVSSDFKNGIRITTAQAMPYILSAVGAVGLQLQGEFSKGLANTPLFGAKISTVMGNFVSAKPFGVRDGVDFGLTGEIRRIDTKAIMGHLDAHHIVIANSVGFSAMGDIFNLNALDVATHIATALTADKLIILNDTPPMLDGQIVREMTTDTAQKCTHPVINHAVQACLNGVNRVHLLDFHINGVLLEELFTTDGVGTMISQTAYDHIRKACLHDIVGMMNVMRPLQEQGVLVARTHNQLMEQIEQFYVIERDGKVIGCACLIPLDDDSAEIASVAIDPIYRQGQRGVALLHFIQNECLAQGRRTLFALTTRTLHWFIEQGFVQTDPSHLPPARLKQYHNGRNSKVLVKYLKTDHT